MNLERMSLAALRAELLRNPDPQYRVEDSADIRFGSIGQEVRGDNKLLRHRLSVAREILVRAAHEELIGRDCIADVRACKDYLRLHFANLPYEVFVVVYLDAHHRVICAEQPFAGTLNCTSVYPREIARRALELAAGAVVVAHQHPTGIPEPSRADETLTVAIRDTLATVDVRLIDHVVFGAGKFVSFAETGRL